MANQVERQRIYRQRLAERGAVSGSGTKAPRGAPESREVVQALAGAVRALAAEMKADSGAAKANGPFFQKLMARADGILRERGFDGAEVGARLLLYVLPPEQRKRRLARDAEGRYWSPPPPPSTASKTGVEKR